MYFQKRQFKGANSINNTNLDFIQHVCMVLNDRHCTTKNQQACNKCKTINICINIKYEQLSYH